MGSGDVLIFSAVHEISRTFEFHKIPGWGNFFRNEPFTESQIYPHMRVKFGRGRRLCRKGGGGGGVQTDKYKRTLQLYIVDSRFYRPSNCHIIG